MPLSALAAALALAGGRAADPAAVRHLPPDHSFFVYLCKRRAGRDDNGPRQSFTSGCTLLLDDTARIDMPFDLSRPA